MGSFSDTLERIRENSDFDPCLLAVGIQKTQFHDAIANTFDLPRIEEQSKLKEKQRLLSFSEQYTQLYNLEANRKAYEKAVILLDKCIYRQKQLLRYEREYDFASHTVRDTLSEYISLVEDTIAYGWNRLSEVEKQAKNLPQIWPHIDENEETIVSVSTIVESVFCFLSSSDIDDSQYIQTVFSDIAILIGLLPNVITTGKQPKVICREYYISKYRPTTGIEICENCGKLLYKGFPYCFDCFERSYI